MTALTPQFLFDLESRMRVIQEYEFQELTDTEHQWYETVTKETTTDGKKQRFIWMLDTADIQYQGHAGGQVQFEELMSRTVEYEPKAATGGFQVNRNDLEDLDGGGIDQAFEWTRQITAKQFYWPQRQTAILMRNGSNVTAYDGVSFFNNAHPLNPFNTAAGTYANDFTGAANSTPATDPADALYPGALDISTAVTLDVAFANLQKAIAYIRAIRMPDGVTPRFLRPAAIIVPPALQARIQQMLNAKFIAQAAATGGGAADVEAIISAWGLGQPIVADELGSGNNEVAAGSDTTWYIVTRQAGRSNLGAFNYVNREPFGIVYNDQMSDAQLARANEIQWLTRGRNTIEPGHPYCLFRVQAT